MKRMEDLQIGDTIVVSEHIDFGNCKYGNICHRMNGTVLKIEGDKLTVLFGDDECGDPIGVLWVDISEIY